MRELEHVISRAALKALSRGASRNDIVTLEADLLDLDALQSATAPTAAAPTGSALPEAAPAARPCAKPSTPASARPSSPPWSSTGATGPTRRASWAWTPATCTSWRGALGLK
jgi:anaerobic nitric oxide reductase transcription regulator